MNAIAGIVGNWNHVKWWMERYVELHVDTDDETYTRLLFSDFIAWVSNQQPLSADVIKEIDDGQENHTS
jgi:hypothetical protein